MAKLITLVLLCLGLYACVTCTGSIPVIVSPQNPTVVETGETAVLRCVIDNLGFRVVVWRKESSVSPLTIGSFVYTSDRDIGINVIQEDNGRKSFNLIIRNAQQEDTGTYQCQITGRHTVKQDYVLYVL